MKHFFVVSLLFSFICFVSINAQDFSADPNGPYTPVQTESAAEVEVHYDGANTNGVGAADANFIIAAKFTPTLLAPYVGTGLVKLRVYIRDATVGNTATVKVFSAGTASAPGPEIYSANVTTLATSWNEWVISPFILVPNADLWVGLQATAGPTGTQFWGGVDAGPNDPNGQFIYFNNAWATLIALNPALTYNWNIRGVIETTIPVELSSFSAAVSGRNVNLNWTTATEVNNRGFEIQRQVGSSEYVTIAFVEGKGTTTETQTYSYADQNLAEGTYSYRLKQIDLNGNFEFSEPVLAEILTPLEYSLAQNFPNPFNPSTTISFGLTVDSKVVLEVFNVLGQKVAEVLNTNIAAGQHDIQFSASGLESGVYFYTIRAQGIDGSDFSSTKKMILMK